MAKGYHCPRHIKYTDDEVISAYLRIGTQDGVKEELGISHTSVYRILKRNGIQATGRKHNGGYEFQTNITNEKLIEESKKLSCEEIAKKYDISPERVWTRLRRLGIKPIKKWTRNKILGRAKFYGCEESYDDEITIESVFDRDKGICKICGKPVDWNSKNEKGHPLRLYPTIDHIVPFSKGGEHIWENVQLAHLGCNAKKKDNV